MRLLFAHDHRFQRGPKGQVYTLGSFPAAVWDRYLEHFTDIHVIARDGGRLAEGDDLARSDRPGVGFELLENASSLRHLALPSAGMERQMADAVRGADAVVARLPSEIGMLAIKHARQEGKPYAVEVAGCPWDGYFHHGALAARLYAPLGYLRMRRSLKAAPLALYVTSHWLQQRYPSSGSQASASNVELVPFTTADEKRRDKRLAAIAGGKKPVFGTVGSLRTKAKGIQVALAALAKLRKSGVEVEYRVIGPGDRKPWIRLAEQLGVADLVHFDGVRTPGEGVAAWLDEIDVHLQPSFREGLPRATIEAMSRGVACVGSTCGGIPELLPPVRLHRPGDVATLADRIRWLAGDAQALIAASRADRDMACQFDPDELKRRRSAFFGQLRQQSKPAGPKRA